MQKFVKSQLRSQKYQLKLSEIYPVLPDEIEMSGPIRDLDCGRDMEGGDEPQEEYIERTVPRSDVQCNRSGVQDDVDIDPQTAAMHMNESATTVVADAEDLVDAAAEVAVEDDCASPAGEVVLTVPDRSVSFAVERSKRERSKPKWMSSGEFVVG